MFFLRYLATHFSGPCPSLTSDQLAIASEVHDAPRLCGHSIPGLHGRTSCGALRPLLAILHQSATCGACSSHDWPQTHSHRIEGLLASMLLFNASLSETNHFRSQRMCATTLSPIHHHYAFVNLNHASMGGAQPPFPTPPHGPIPRTQKSPPSGITTPPSSRISSAF